MEADSIQSTETFMVLAAWFHANRKKVMIAGAVVVAAGLVWGFMSWQKDETETNADTQLMNTPLVTVKDGRPVPTPASSFFDVAKQYPGTSAGEYAQLLGAQRLFQDAKYPEAQSAFSKFIDDNQDSPLIPQAKVGIAASLEGQGKASEAAQKYQELISSYSSEPNIVSPAKLTLARLDEQLNKPEQALQYYMDLARIQNPYDPWSAEARERGQLLLMKHPELQKAPPVSTGGLPPASQPKPSGLTPMPSSPKPGAPAAAKP